MNLLLIILPTLTLSKVTSGLIPLHRHDSFTNCIQQYKSEAVYCYAKVYIVPDSTVSAWQEIHNHSKDTQHHFRYDLLQRSVCVNDCLRTPSVKVPKFNIDPAIYYPSPQLNANSPQHKSKYSQVVNDCVNVELQMFELKGYAELELCHVQEEEEKSKYFDWLELSVIILLLSVVVLTLTATIYDYNRPQEINTTLGALMSFSFLRNWENFTTLSNKTSDSFAFFEGLRVLLIILNTFQHVFMSFNLLPLVNPEFFEQMSHDFLYKVFACVFSNQIFFAFSGFLLTLPVVKKINAGQLLTVADFKNGITTRFFRMAPLMMFVMLLEMTLVKRLYFGPIWGMIAGVERSYCRRNWWTNLLFINTIVRREERCMQFCKYQRFFLDSNK